MFIVINLRNPTVPVPHFGVEGWAVFRFKVRMPRALLRRFGAVRVRVVGLGVFLGLAYWWTFLFFKYRLWMLATFYGSSHGSTTGFYSGLYMMTMMTHWTFKDSSHQSNKGILVWLTCTNYGIWKILTSKPWDVEKFSPANIDFNQTIWVL